MKELTLTSNAKVNLGLDIVGRREDGYHLIDTVFQEVDFGDQLHFRRIKADECRLSSDSPDFPRGAENLCTQAFWAMKKRYSEIAGVRLHAEKRIPAGAGLGGGSSNAATTLLAIAQIYNLQTGIDELLGIAQSLGADVPFFLYGGIARGTGIGEHITPLEQRLEVPLVIVMPAVHIPTEWAYDNVSYTLTPKGVDDNLERFFEKRGRLRRIRNVFEPLIIERYSEIGDIRQRLYHLQADHVSISGSGAAIFGLFPDTETASNAAQALSQDYRTVVTQPVYRPSPRFATVLPH